MSYFFSFNIKNNFSDAITISGDIVETVNGNTTKSFHRELPSQICNIYLNLPSEKNVFEPTSTSIAITGGTYLLYVKNTETAFRLKIKNSSGSTTNVTIGDNQ
jgi:hypothetical protein